jgi:MerR family transcriptional regulator, thiopeptide resistance regulator
MRPVEGRTYQTREFAHLAGVTARALHHYDRLGLLKPKRTRAGYRAYSARDFERLEQIIALKFIGVPLKKIRFFTTRTAEGLANALRAQRQTLEAKRQLLDQAIAAIGEAENVVRAGRSADPTLYRRIIEVIEMQNNTDEWNKKYDSLIQAKIERLRAIPPSEMTELRQQWTVLVGDIQQSLGEDPGGAKAQELAARWVNLLEHLMGGPVDPSMIGSAAAYQTTGSWSPSGTAVADKRVWDFVSNALASRH